MSLMRKYAPHLLGLVPAVLCFVTFILTTLAMCAGHQKNFMEDYAVIRLNTSMLGQDYFSGKVSTSINQDDAFIGLLKGEWHGVEDQAKGKAGDSAIAGVGMPGSLAQKLGVSSWYSMHIMNSCEGNYGPNHLTLNVTRCSSSSPTYSFNLTRVLDHDMSAGPLHVNLADLIADWPKSVQEKIDDVNSALFAIFVFYVLGVCFSGLATITAVVSTFYVPENRQYLFIVLNIALTSIAAFFIVLAAIVVTAAGIIGASTVNDVGKNLNMVAERGAKICIISCAAAGLIVLANLLWAARLLLLKRKMRKQRQQQRMAEEGKLTY